MSKELKINTKLLSAFLAVFILVASLPLAGMSALAATSGDYEYEVYESGNTQIRRYFGSDTEVTIPSELDGHIITGIENNAFNSSNITKVTIPDSVTGIAPGAFVGCYNLKEIIMPDSVTELGLGFNAFSKDFDIYYTGSEEQWYKISIIDQNWKYISMADDSINATIHFNYVPESDTPNDTVTNEATEATPNEPTTDNAVTEEPTKTQTTEAEKKPAEDEKVAGVSASSSLNNTLLPIIVITGAVIGAAVVVTVIVKKKKIK